MQFRGLSSSSTGSIYVSATKAMTLSLSDRLISVVKQIPNPLPNLKLAQLQELIREY